MPYVGGEIASIVRPRLAARATRQMVNKGGARWRELAMMNTPIAPPPAPEEIARRGKHGGRRPRGTARASWRQKETMPMPGGGGWYSGVESHDPVMPFIEWNTKPHIIRPIPPNRRLAFFQNGSWRFPVLVHHPGTTGQAPLRISAAKVEHEAEHGLFDAILREWKMLSEVPA